MSREKGTGQPETVTGCLGQMTKRDAGKIIIMILLLAACIMLAGHIGSLQQREETKMVSDAVREALLTCYAVEGAYPSDVDYLREYYRLSYDTERYIVSFDAFASNHVPDVFVMERGAGAV